MLRQLLLSDIDAAGFERAEGWALLAAEFPTVAVQPLGSGAGAQVLCLDVEEWLCPGFEPRSWDARVLLAAEAERLALHLVGAEGEVLAQAALEILTRYQGLLGRRNAASAGAGFSRILARHRALHDLDRPLVRADYQHALDTWQWVLRLEPEADLAVQMAALFHDVERLHSRVDCRAGLPAEEDALSREAHAALGAELTRALLEELEMDAATCERVHWLITRHERPGEDSAQALLNEADALSFFSLEASGFVRSCGPEHARGKVAHTLARLRPGHSAWLAHMRLAPGVRALLPRPALDAPRPGDGVSSPHQRGSLHVRTIHQ